IDSDEDGATEEKRMGLRVFVRPDDLARVIDAKCLGARDAQGVIEGGEAAAAKDKSVEVSAPTGRPRERPNDLTRAVDAFCLGVQVVGGIVDRGEDIDWHVVTLLTASRLSSAPRPRYGGSSHHSDADLDARNQNQVLGSGYRKQSD